MNTRRTLCSLAAATAVAMPVADAVAATRATTTKTTAKKKVVTVSKTVNGQLAEASRWGEVQVVVAYTKTTTTLAGGKKTVKIKLTKVTAPTVPNHTDRSSYISSQAIPLLTQEVVQIQPTHSLSTFRLVSGATDTSYAFAQSLQAALLAIGK